MAITLGRGALFTANLVISQGADNNFWFRYGSASDPVDLTGWTARSQIRSKVGGDVWADLDVTLGGTQGTVLVHLGHAVTEGWDDSQKYGAWDLELLDQSGAVLRFVEGAVKVDHDVTRAE